MASSSDVVKKVMRCKLQLTDSADSATVVKILQKLKDLEITLDVLAETGIGKTVNSLRRHKRAGEIAKSLVSSWKRLIPKGSTSQTEDVEASESLSAKDKVDQHSPKNGHLTAKDLNNNCLTSYCKSHKSSDEAESRRKSDRKADSEALKTNKKERGQKGKESKLSEEKKQEDKTDDSAVSKKKKIKRCDKESRGSNCSEDTQNSWSYPKEKIKNRSEREKSEKESKKKSRTSQETTSKSKDSLSLNSNDKYSRTFQEAAVRDDKNSEKRRDTDKTKKRKEKPPKSERESENDEHKNKKRKHKERDPEEPLMSFESFLNYDVNVCKRKEKSAAKKAAKKIKTSVKDEESGDHDARADEMDSNAASPKPRSKGSIMDLINVPLPAALPECDKPSCEEYLERKVEKEPEICDEASQVFTGQRLNKKMQVYSGNKAVSLPAMMSLHQQCIRTLQNNINLLYETGGVPLEILEPVLERCTPEQLLRIEECNPVYIGATDHLWGKHCQRDFKDSKLQEYESWKEMYMRLYEERERKFKMLSKSISSAHSNKPKGRQVKMAFVHTAAKPPRGVRIQQVIHGTAAQPPPQLRCSVKVQDSKAKTSSEDHSRSSSTGSGAGNTQDPRKKPKVAPIMAKSLKAFKKQMGRR